MNHGGSQRRTQMVQGPSANQNPDYDMKPPTPTDILNQSSIVRPSQLLNDVNSVLKNYQQMLLHQKGKATGTTSPTGSMPGSSRTTSSARQPGPSSHRHIQQPNHQGHQPPQSQRTMTRPLPPPAPSSHRHKQQPNNQGHQSPSQSQHTMTRPLPPPLLSSHRHIQQPKHIEQNPSTALPEPTSVVRPPPPPVVSPSGDVQELLQQLKDCQADLKRLSDQSTSQGRPTSSMMERTVVAQQLSVIKDLLQHRLTSGTQSPTTKSENSEQNSPVIKTEPANEKDVQQKKINPFGRRATPSNIPASTTVLSGPKTPEEEDEDEDDEDSSNPVSHLSVGSILSSLTGQSSYTARGTAVKMSVPAIPKWELQAKPVCRVTKPPPQIKPENAAKRAEELSKLLEKLKEKYPESPTNFIELLEDGYCPFCQAPVTSLQTAILHFNGKKHQSKLAFYDLPTGNFVINESEDAIIGKLSKTAEEMDLGELKADYLVMIEARKVCGSHINVTQCHVCDVSFKSPLVAYYHYAGTRHKEAMEKNGIEVSTEKMPSPLFCIACGVPTSSEADLKFHLGGDQHKKVVEGLKKPAPVQNSQHFCDICNISTTSRDGLEIHFAGQKHKQVLEGKKAPKGQTLNRSDEETFYCDICNIYTTSQQILDLHTAGLKHTEVAMGLRAPNPNAIPPPNISGTPIPGVKPGNVYVCTICNIGASSDELLRTHFHGKKHNSKCARMGLPANSWTTPEALGGSLRPPDLSKAEAPPDTLLEMIEDGVCPFCQVNVSGPEEAVDHYNTPKHQEKLAFYDLPTGEFNGPVPGTKEPEKEPEPAIEMEIESEEVEPMMPVQKSLHATLIEELIPDVPQDILQLITTQTCVDCCVIFNGIKQAQNHYNGRKHQQLLALKGMGGLYTEQLPSEAELSSRNRPAGRGNTFGGPPRGNTFGDAPKGNAFGGAPGGNTFGGAPRGHAFGDAPEGNAFGGAPGGNTFGGPPRGNAFGDAPEGNAFGDAPRGNVFGDSPEGNAFGGAPGGNTFGDAPEGNTFGDAPRGNTFGGPPRGNAFRGPPRGNAFRGAPRGNAFRGAPRGSSRGDDGAQRNWEPQEWQAPGDSYPRQNNRGNNRPPRRGYMRGGRGGQPFAKRGRYEGGGFNQGAPAEEYSGFFVDESGNSAPVGAYNEWQEHFRDGVFDPSMSGGN